MVNEELRFPLHQCSTCAHWSSLFFDEGYAMATCLKKEQATRGSDGCSQWQRIEKPSRAIEDGLL